MWTGPASRESWVFPAAFLLAQVTLTFWRQEKGHRGRATGRPCRPAPGPGSRVPPSRARVCGGSSGGRCWRRARAGSSLGQQHEESSLQEAAEAAERGHEPVGAEAGVAADHALEDVGLRGKGQLRAELGSRSPSLPLRQPVDREPTPSGQDCGLQQGPVAPRRGQMVRREEFRQERRPLGRRARKPPCPRAGARRGQASGSLCWVPQGSPRGSEPHPVLPPGETTALGCKLGRAKRGPAAHSSHPSEREDSCGRGQPRAQGQQPAGGQFGTQRQCWGVTNAIAPWAAHWVLDHQGE